MTILNTDSEMPRLEAQSRGRTAINLLSAVLLPGHPLLAIIRERQRSFGLIHYCHPRIIPGTNFHKWINRMRTCKTSHEPPPTLRNGKKKMIKSLENVNRRPSFGQGFLLVGTTDSSQRSGLLVCCHTLPPALEPRTLSHGSPQMMSITRHSFRDHQFSKKCRATKLCQCYTTTTREPEHCFRNCFTSENNSSFSTCTEKQSFFSAGGTACP